MPTISMFYGIIVRMYCAPSEHNPPHIHVHYQSYKATIDIHTCEIIDGELPKKQAKLATAWAEIHQEELMADWELASSGTKPFPIEPLK